MKIDYTQEQVMLIFSIFRAQNANKTIGDLFPNKKENRDVLIGDLRLDKIHLFDKNWGHFYYNETRQFYTWDSAHEPYYSFDIFKFISFEDKI